MLPFKEIQIGFNFYIKNCFGFSRWIKISKTMASNIEGKVGIYELNQHKPFSEKQLTYNLHEFNEQNKL